MCGIAGIVHLGGEAAVDRIALARMARAIVHRGPDEEGFYFEPGVGLASRRLSIVGLADGQQPLFNEDGAVVAAVNGELFEYPELRAELARKGHIFRSGSDSEVLVHLWEEYGEDLFDRLRGQFAFALLDRRRRTLILARDRVGVCPLHWARRGEWLYFGSEIKAILASGRVAPQADLRGIDHVFTYLAMGSRRTAFEGVSSIPPGTYLRIQFRDGARGADVVERRYWDFDFPDAGDEYNPSAPQALEELRDIVLESVSIRLRADVPVVSYLSGGVDSSLVAAAAARIRGESVPLFTIQITGDAKLDETGPAQVAAEAVGGRTIVVPTGHNDIATMYPTLVRAADCPVVDTSCASLACLAKAVHEHGYRVALTGEGADDALGGYPWFKGNRLARMFDVGPIRPSAAVRRAFFRYFAPEIPWSQLKRTFEAIGGVDAFNDFYGIMSLSRQLYYRPETFEALEGRSAYDDFNFDVERIRRWSPLNRTLYLGYKTMIAGLLLNHKGDRPAMNSSVETRYPFLDEKFVAYCSRLHPRWKIRGIWKDKQALRLVARDFLPERVANRPKAIFHAPMAASFFCDSPAYVDQLLTRESLERTGCFDADRVLARRAACAAMRPRAGRRLAVEMGLAAVTATQIWHHMFLGGGLCELPTWEPPEVDRAQPLHVRRPPVDALRGRETA